MQRQVRPNYKVCSETADMCSKSMEWLMFLSWCRSSFSPFKPKNFLLLSILYCLLFSFLFLKNIFSIISLWKNVFSRKHLFISFWFSLLSPLFFGEGRRREILIVLKNVMFYNMFSWQEIHRFPRFISFFFVIFLSFFLLRSRRSDGRCQNTSSREKSEANGGNGHQGMKKVLCWRVFEHHRRSELMDQSQPRRLRPSAGYFRQRFSNSMFLVIDWLVCDTDSQWDTRWWRLVFMFSDEQREAEKLNQEDIMVCVEDQKLCQKNQKMWKGNSMNWKKKQANWQIDEHMSNYHERRVQQGLGEEFKERSCQTRDATLAKFRSGNRFTGRRWVVVWKEMMNCGIDGRARMEKRTQKEATCKQRTRRDRSLVSRVGNFAHSAAQRCAEKCRGATDIQYIAVCHGKTNSRNLECSETVEADLQNAVQRWSGQCLSRNAEAFSHHSKEKTWWNHPESVVKSQIACAVKTLLCGLRHGRKPRSMSSHLHYLLFPQYVCIIFSDKISLLAFSLFPSIFNK